MYCDKYSPYGIELKRPVYTREMSNWVKALPDVHWIYGAGHVTLHFSREEDLTAFKLTFEL